MNTLPGDLTSRLKNIYSQQEINSLQAVFALEKRPVTFRLNTHSSTSEEIETALEKASIQYTQLDFPQNSYLLDESFTESDLWRLKIYKHGEIYVQGLSSQIPVSFFKPDLSQLSDQGRPLKILDACAAPGGKTSQLSALYPDAEIVAFEPFKVRFEKMQHNLKKLGCENVRAIHDEIRNIGEYIEEENYFDIILIDAPCSSEGGISLHNKKYLDNWDVSHIKKNYRRQKYILDDVLPYLSDQGELIYTTCTLAPEENEGIVHYILCNHPEMQLENIDLLENKHIKQSGVLKNFEKSIYKTEISEKCIRVIPSEFSEGFFISKFTKKAAL